MADAAIHYARAAREPGVLVSLDGGALRPRIEELIDFVDVAVVSKKLCEQMGLSEARHARLAEVQGLPRRRRDGRREGHLLVRRGRRPAQHLPSLHVPPELVVDTSGAGDVFHGAYCASYLERPGRALARALRIRPRGVGP